MTPFTMVLGAVLYDAHERWSKLAGLLLQQRRVGMGRERGDVKRVGVSAEDAKRRRADRASRPKDGHAAACHCGAGISHTFRSQ